MSKHLSVPARKGLNGFFATVDDDDAIQENIRQIFFVSPNERIMRNDIGVPMNSLVWELADEVFYSILKFFIRSRMKKFENRVKLLGVEVSREERDEDGGMIVSAFIQYQKLNSRQIKSMTLQAIYKKNKAA